MGTAWGMGIGKIHGNKVGRDNDGMRWGREQFILPCQSLRRVLPKISKSQVSKRRLSRDTAHA